ncbi:MAG: hypothetical protein IJ874_07025 [Ruminococcus sp.]|nr:hypothetical protein [Ruminococcus sp.]
MSADPAAAEEFLRIAGDIFDGDECSPEEGWYYASRYLFELSWSGRDIDEVLAEFSACTEQQWEEIVSGLGAGGKYRCPCCGEYSLDEPPGKYDICSVCGWEDDPVQLKDPDFAGGANRLSLNEARAEYIGKKTK